MSEYSKSLLIILPVFLFFLFNSSWIGTNQDHSFHEAKAFSTYFGEKDPDKTYPPLLSHLSGVFNYRPIVFKFFMLFLIIVIIPLLIVRITKNHLGALFYFATSSSFYFLIGGLYSQALLTIFILLLIAEKNTFFRLFVVLIGALSHSTAYLVLPAVLFLLLFFENNWSKDFFAFCSPVWGDKLPSVVSTQLNSVSYGAQSIHLNDIGSLFSKIAPFPFLIIGLKHFFQTKQYVYLVLIVSCFVFAWFENVRTFYLIGTFSTIGFTMAYPSLVLKRWWLLFTIAFGLFLFSQFYFQIEKILC